MNLEEWYKKLRKSDPELKILPKELNKYSLYIGTGVSLKSTEIWLDLENSSRLDLTGGRLINNDN